MKTQINILVKDETIFSKSLTLLWFINIFKKSKMLVYVDGQQYELKASRTPHAFEVEPGTHTVEFRDPKEGWKRFYWKTVGLFIGFAFGLAGSNTIGDFQLSMMETSQISTMSDRENCLVCTLQDGDVLNLSCKSSSRASIKVKTI